MDHRLPLQQQADALGLDQVAEHFLHHRRQLLQQGLAGLLLRGLQLAGHVLEVGLLGSQLLARRELLLLAHDGRVLLEVLHQFVELLLELVELLLVGLVVLLAPHLFQLLLGTVGLQDSLLQVDDGDLALGGGEGRQGQRCERQGQFGESGHDTLPLVTVCSSLCVVYCQ